MGHNPTYQIEDILHIARGFPFPALLHSASTERVFAAMLAVLRSNPELKSYASIAACEDLELAAALLRLLSVQGAEIRDDLAFSTGKTNLINLAVLLALLAPQRSDGDFYDKLVDHIGHKSWLLEIVNAPVDKPVSDDARNICQMIVECREIFSGIDLPDVEIWKISEIPQEELDLFRAELSKKYKKGGAAAAEVFLYEIQSSQGDRLGRYLRYCLRR